ncbi:MAG: hypothetical protein LUO89_08775, partial [Methanothrix sp.]|nr:hypothetical protein [Methanothrix sp.]
AQFQVVCGAGEKVAGNAPGRGPGTVAGRYAYDPDLVAQSKRLLYQAAARQRLVVRMRRDDNDALVGLEAKGVEARSRMP